MSKKKLIDISNVVHDDIGNYKVRELSELELEAVSGGFEVNIGIACGTDVNCDDTNTDCSCISDLWCDDGQSGGSDWFCDHR